MTKNPTTSIATPKTPFSDISAPRASKMRFVRTRAGNGKHGAAAATDVDPHFEDRAETPWRDQLVLRERTAWMVMNSDFVFADIDYADGLIAFGDAGTRTGSD